MLIYTSKGVITQNESENEGENAFLLLLPFLGYFTQFILYLLLSLSLYLTVNVPELLLAM